MTVEEEKQPAVLRVWEGGPDRRDRKNQERTSMFQVLQGGHCGWNLGREREVGGMGWESEEGGTPGVKANLTAEAHLR